MYRLTLLIFIIFVTFIKLSAQQLSPTVISSGGGFTNEGSYTLSFTIGETSVKTVSTNSNILTQGFQQGLLSDNPIFQVSETKVFPNPVSKVLFVVIKAYEAANFKLTTYSVTGKVILTREYNNLSAGYYDEINVSYFAKGLYLIKIESLDGAFQRTFKIEKL